MNRNNKDHDRQWSDGTVEVRRIYLDALDRAKDRDGRRNRAVAIK